VKSSTLIQTWNSATYTYIRETDILLNHRFCLLKR
jgi:hypothetical protein